MKRAALMPVLVLVCVLGEAVGEPAANRSALEWYERAVDAYLSEDWAGCVAAMENAIVEWHFFRGANVACRLRCGAEARRTAPLFPEDVEHLHVVEELVRATLCIIRCKRAAFRGRATPDGMSGEQQRPFRTLKTYEYLQLCYYQVSEYQKAASAIFTILVHDPDNEVMKHNLKFYLSLPQVDGSKLANFEAKRFVSLYQLGTEAYYSDDFKEAITNLEASLEELYKTIEECRADCEGPFDQGWLPDFTSSIANHFTYCLKCKSKCYSKLSLLSGEKQDDLLAMHYNFLQFAYYKVENVEAACAAAKTYLLFAPGDETMLQNLKYYKSMSQVDAKNFNPRQEAVTFVKRKTYEDALLKFISDEFIFEDSHDSEKQIPQLEEMLKRREVAQSRETLLLHHLNKRLMPSAPSKLRSSDPAFLNDNGGSQPTLLCNSLLSGKVAQETGGNFTMCSHRKEHTKTKSIENYLEKELVVKFQSSMGRSIHSILLEVDLNGVKRFKMDGLAGRIECEQMVQFAKIGAVSGDGYNGNISPLSPLERFEGVTLARAALMFHHGLIELSTLNLFLRLSQRVKEAMSIYFKLPADKLYFSFTHLVSRSALNVSSPAHKKHPHFSHEIHADNCWLHTDGSCKRAAPAFFWRDYSAILYLNDDFEGGDFIFSADPHGGNIQASITPQCGRVVGFSAGRENLHGVQSVKRGSRFALALWFTLDPDRPEWGRLLTDQMIKSYEKGEKPTEELLEDLRYISKFDLEETTNRIRELKSSEEFQKNNLNV